MASRRSKTSLITPTGAPFGSAPIRLATPAISNCSAMCKPELALTSQLIRCRERSSLFTGITRSEATFTSESGSSRRNELFEENDHEIIFRNHRPGRTARSRGRARKLHRCHHRYHVRIQSHYVEGPAGPAVHQGVREGAQRVRAVRGEECTQAQRSEPPAQVRGPTGQGARRSQG